jgi:hypothetical protein
MFSKFGSIIECKVMVDRYTGVSRQIGFVRFSTVEEASLAMDSMNTVKLDASAPPLIVKYADTKVYLNFPFLTIKEQKTARKSLRSHYVPMDMNPYSQLQSPVYFYYPPSSPPAAYGFTYPYQGYGFSALPSTSPSGVANSESTSPGTPTSTTSVTPGTTPPANTGKSN